MENRSKRERRAAAALVVGALALVILGAQGAPREATTPNADDEVLATVPARGRDPVAAERARLRRSLDARPGDLDTASRLARMLIAAARVSGDPRFLGRAEAALGPWWDQDQPPAEALLLRATIRQSRHEFAPALADLDRLVAAAPGDAQAWLTRAVVLGVRGRYAEALASCAHLKALVSSFVVAACRAPVLGVTGKAAGAAAALAAEMRFARTPSEVAWAEGLRADLEVWSGDSAGAAARLRRLLARAPDDRAARATLADLYLDDARPADAQALTDGFESDDGLLLRRALARVAGGADPATDDAVAAMAARFEAARLRGDPVHQREEARFALAVARDPARALRLAEENWQTQKEPADARVLLEAALAARAPRAATPALAWLAETGCAWPPLGRLAAALRGLS